jgi:cbb3-type cytochrome oxidase cytochrome c subunit
MNGAARTASPARSAPPLKSTSILIAFSLYAISFGLLVPIFPQMLNEFTNNNVERSSLYFGLGEF